MRRDYYAVLGLEPGADAKEIKRAYFRLVKKYSPEKDPERFQEIRRAYEYLSDPRHQGEPENMVELPDDPTAEKLYDWISQCIDEEDWKRAINTAEQAIHIFGEAEAFLAALADAQRWAGHTGKAARSYEKLIERYPDKLSYRGDLAMTYRERGYAKKALEAFREAYALGYRDMDFLSSYGDHCGDRGCPEEGEQVIREMIRVGREDLKENLEDVLEGYARDLLARGDDETDWDAYLGEWDDFIGEAAPYMDEYEEEFYVTTMTLLTVLSHAKYKDTEKMQALVRKVRGCFPDSSMEDEWNNMESACRWYRLKNDDRFSDVVKQAAEVFSENDLNATERRFAGLDTNLRLLEVWLEVRPELMLLEKEYPEEYEALRDLVDRMDHVQDVERFRARMLKEYDRLAPQFDRHLYYEEYPERRSGTYTEVWNSDEQGEYRRTGKKIGRNEPCPCGSGKKYKNCCGRRA
ncbi:MAG: DnaJ domain-containing protein [Lachnospiraceae bacterium]|nr:DnaJ domain-containing protein [Lachnospiraceae bacterium]